jgi:hypothetical protein
VMLPIAKVASWLFSTASIRASNSTDEENP